MWEAFLLWAEAPDHASEARGPHLRGLAVLWYALWAYSRLGSRGSVEREETQAVAYVAQHPAGDALSTTILPTRDVTMGTASLDTASGTWSFNWGATPYNAVGVTTQRSSVGTSAGDGPLPLIFAQLVYL